MSLCDKNMENNLNTEGGSQSGLQLNKQLPSNTAIKKIKTSVSEKIIFHPSKHSKVHFENLKPNGKNLFLNKDIFW